MPKNYQKNEVKRLRNNYELHHHHQVGLNSKLIEFQKMGYNLQLAESRFTKDKTELRMWVNRIEEYRRLSDDFAELMEYLLDEDIQIEFLQDEPIHSESISRFEKLDYEFLSLFSGGLDSITIPFLQEYKNRSGVLHHTITHKIPQGRVIEIFKKFFWRKTKLELITSIANNKVKDPSYLKTRGLIFLTNALCVASELEIEEVIMPENGPFMVNVPISHRADPTRTADPFMIKEWTKIFNRITSSNVKVSMPFTNKTKAEVILETGNREVIKKTWSCSYFQGLSHMCGLCNSCLVRILSCYAIKEEEEIEKTYNRNIFTEKYSELKDDNKNTYMIAYDAAEFWKNILINDELIEPDKQYFNSIRTLYPIMINHSLDMMLGFRELSKQYASEQPLYKKFNQMLNYIDNNVLDQRQELLMSLKNRRGW